MKKVYILLSGCALWCLCLGGIIYYNDYNKNECVIFSSSKDNRIIEKLEKNKIPYKIDQSGNVKIMEKDTNKATLCCT
jgi:flagellar biosynthesis/type III secretory pathway M-ring protein FliF/YscJ